MNYIKIIFATISISIFGIALSSEKNAVDRAPINPPPVTTRAIPTTPYQSDIFSDSNSTAVAATKAQSFNTGSHTTPTIATTSTVTQVRTLTSDQAGLIYSTPAQHVQMLLPAAVSKSEPAQKTPSLDSFYLAAQFAHSSQTNRHLNMIPQVTELKGYIEAASQINALILSSFKVSDGSHAIAYKVFQDSLRQLAPHMSIPGQNMELQKLVYNICAITHDGNGCIKQSLTKNEYQALALAVTKYLYEVNPRNVYQTISGLAAQGFPGFDYAIRELESRYSSQMSNINHMIKDCLNWVGDVSDTQRRSLISKVMINDVNIQLQQIQTFRQEGRLTEAIGFGTKFLSDGTTIFGRYPQLEQVLHQELLSKQPLITQSSNTEVSTSSTTSTQEAAAQKLTTQSQVYIKNLGYENITFELPSTATTEQKQTHTQLVGLIEHIAKQHSESSTIVVKLFYDHLGHLAADALLYNQNPNTAALKYNDQFYDPATRAQGNISIINSYLENLSSLETFSLLVELYKDYAMSHPIAHTQDLLISGIKNSGVIKRYAAPQSTKPSTLTAFEQSSTVSSAERWGKLLATVDLGLLVRAGSDIAKVAAKRCAQYLPKLASRYPLTTQPALALVNQRAMHSNELPSSNNPAVKSIYDSVKLGERSANVSSEVTKDITNALNKGLVKLPEKMPTVKPTTTSTQIDKSGVAITSTSVTHSAKEFSKIEIALVKLNDKTLVDINKIPWEKISNNLSASEIQILKKGISSFENVEGFLSIEGPTYKALCSINNRTIKGAIYEIEKALELQSKGKTILSFGKHFADTLGNTREFDLIINDELIECKNWDWNNFLGSNISAKQSIFASQAKIANELGKKFTIHSKNSIPENWKLWFASRKINIIEG